MAIATCSSYIGIVAPVRERGLKLCVGEPSSEGSGRSRKGAWIEIFFVILPPIPRKVAPVRERGLKWMCRN